MRMPGAGMYEFAFPLPPPCCSGYVLLPPAPVPVMSIYLSTLVLTKGSGNVQLRASTPIPAIHQRKYMRGLSLSGRLAQALLLALLFVRLSDAQRSDAPEQWSAKPEHGTRQVEICWLQYCRCITLLHLYRLRLPVLNTAVANGTMLIYLH
jgi:hypothetical protein